MIAKEVLNDFKGKNILITGGTGLIGRQLVDILYNAGANICIVSLDDLKINDNVNHIKGDLSDFNFCKEITRGMDHVFHLAGIKGSIEVVVKKPASVLVPILMMNTNVLEASRINGVKKLVYTSTIGAYSATEIFRESEYSIESKPMELSGWAKRMAELQIDAYKVQYGLQYYSVVRPSNVYGPGDNFDPKNAMVIPSLIHRIYSEENPLVVWGDGTAIRDFVFSRDCAEGIILALYYGTKSAHFLNIGSGTGVSIRELVETLLSFIDFNYEFDPTKPTGFPKRVMDISLAKQLINYNPTTSLREGLEKTWHWFIKHQNEYLLRKNYFKEI
jgi:GDP-L-fucose synthase